MGSIPIEVKRKLGLIIHKKRLALLEETKSYYKVGQNPYTKENFSHNICHYHTLTKLEKDYVDDDFLYHAFLNKVGYQFTTYNHEENMDIINRILSKLIFAIEYINDSLVEELKNELMKLDVKDDCIALIHVYLINSMFNLQFIRAEDNYFNEVILLKDMYEGLYKGVYNHVLGIHYLNKLDLINAERYIFETKEIYDFYEVNKGVLYTTIIALYYLKCDYLKMVNLCNEMENYYIKTQNNRRLLHIYNYMADYFFIIKATNLAFEYHNKRMKLFEVEPSLNRYRFAIEYNMGLYLIENNQYEEAYKYLYEALKTANQISRIKILSVLLFVMNHLNKKEEEIKLLIQENEQYLDYALPLDQVLFKYFKYKYEKNQYYRKFGKTKAIPFLMENPARIDFVLMMYQDLYER